MANEIYLNINNTSSTSQGITLWQQPAATDVDTNGAIYGFATAPSNSNLGVTIGSGVFNSNNGLLYIHTTNTNLAKYDSVTNTIVGNATTLSRFYSKDIYSSANNTIISLARTTVFGAITTIVNFDCTLETFTSAASPSGNTSGIAENKINGDIYVFYYSLIFPFTGSTIALYSPTLTPIGSISIDGDNFNGGSAFDTNQDRLYFATNNGVSDTLYALDTDPLSINYNTIIATIPTGITIVDMFFNPNDNNLYVFSSSDIYIYETSTYTLINQVSLGFINNGITFDSNSNVFYIKDATVTTNISVYNALTGSFNGVITFPNAVSPYAVNTITNTPIFLNTSVAQTLSFLNIGNTIQTDGIPTYSQLVNSMYGANPYKFTKLYISTTSIQQANQPITVNYTAPDGRLNTDLRFPSINPTQRQFVIPELNLDMTANGQSNLVYNILPNTDVTMIFSYEQPSAGENIEEVEPLYEDVTEKFKQLEISRKNNPLLDMKWDI
jgi:hypothetical protein